MKIDFDYKYKIPFYNYQLTAPQITITANEFKKALESKKEWLNLCFLINGYCADACFRDGFTKDSKEYIYIANLLRNTDKVVFMIIDDVYDGSSFLDIFILRNKNLLDVRAENFKG